MADTDHYKVDRLLDGILPEAAKPQKSGASFDLRLYLREKEDGSCWAEVAFLDRTGKLLHNDDRTLPLGDPTAISWFFDRIQEKGYPIAKAVRTKPRGS